MRSIFSWYLKPSDEEIAEIWKQGILTVDANVLLDMYRYHQSTRKSLIESIESFNGRLWLSHQAATEFLKNRYSVIASYKKSFNEASDAVDSIEKNLTSAVQAIRNARIIPEETIADLKEAIHTAITTAKERISAAESSHPNYMEEDPLLDKIMEVFTSSVGDPFPEADQKAMAAEAERRIKDKIPPGYLDTGKDGQRPYGDFFLWKQILAQAKLTTKPIIFVTSDRKDDWWERHSGITAGPRYELLKEAYEVSGQRILIYQTDHFLKSATMFRSSATENEANSTLDAAIEEIRAVDAFRVKSGTAVNVLDQMPELVSASHNSGYLVVEITRSILMFTASGHFSPELSAPPTISVQLITSPDGIPEHRLYARTGTTHDFNIHMKSTQPNSPLHPGIYVFHYEALASQSSLFPKT